MPKLNWIVISNEVEATPANLNLKNVLESLKVEVLPRSLEGLYLNTCWERFTKGTDDVSLIRTTVTDPNGRTVFQDEAEIRVIKELGRIRVFKDLSSVSVSKAGLHVFTVDLKEESGWEKVGELYFIIASEKSVYN